MPLIQHHLTKWFILALVLIVPIVPFYLLETSQHPIKHAFSSPTELYQMYAGDLEDGAWLDPSLEWEHYRYAIHGRNVSGTYWFKFELPENQWRNPHMIYYYQHNVDMYLEDQHVYDWNWPSPSPYVEKTHTHLVELPTDFSGQTLYFRVSYDGQALHPGHFFIDSKFNLIAQLVINSNYRIVLGFVSLLIGITGLLLFMRQRERSILYFSLFALYIVYLTLSRSWMLMGLYVSLDWLPFLHNVLLAFGGYCFLRFFETVFGPGPFHIHRRLWQFFIGIFVVMVITAIIAPLFHTEVMTVVLETYIAPLMLVIVFISSIITYRKEKDAESFWFMAGFVVFAIFSCMYFIHSSLIKYFAGSAPELVTFIRRATELFYNNDRFMQSIFVLLFCMVMIVGERIRTVYFEAKESARQLKALSDSLEELVQERTAELEDTNVNLRASMQETSQALAEVAVLEERNRIARDMHDHVGHALTAALIQIEAAKLLITKDTEQALDKMTASRESISQGLESIRDTVRKMKQDYESSMSNYVAALRQLVDDVENKTGVVVQFNVDPKLAHRDELAGSERLRKMIYHALQEGLTNGIKHASAVKFEFSLTISEDQIAFRLSNDGERYIESPYGFGLSAMLERVEQLNGTMHISDHHGQGCLIAIDVPMPSN